MTAASANGGDDHAVLVAAGNVRLSAALLMPSRPIGVVLFAEVSSSTATSPPNLFLAHVLEQAGLASLIVNLLTASEAAVDARTGWIRSEIPLLASRVKAVQRWLAMQQGTLDLPMGVFASASAAPATLVAAAGEAGFAAIVCCLDQAELAWDALASIGAPTLLVTGMEAPAVLNANRALAELQCEKELAIVPGAAHRFEEPGTLEAVAAIAARWFSRHFATEWLAAQRP